MLALLLPVFSVEASYGYELRILHTNDVHGRLEPIDYHGKENVGGFAARAKLIKKIRTENDNVLVLDAGDFAQGTLFYKFFSGIPDIKFMSKAGYDAVELGNHEFDKGMNSLEKVVDESKIPVLCANIKFLNNPGLQTKIKPYVIKDFKGFKVAIIGVIAENLKTLVNNKGGFEVYDVKDTVRDIVSKVDSQADLIIVLSHIGYDEDIKLAKAVPEIDIIVGGHSHTDLNSPKNIFYNGDRTLILQDGEFGVQIGDLKLEADNGEIKNYSYRQVTLDGSKQDRYFRKKISKLSREIESVSNQKIGELLTPIDVTKNNPGTGLTKAGTLIVKSIKAKVPEVDIVLQNAGGLRGSGPVEKSVTKRNVFELYPFENNIITAEIKGSDLKSIIETSSSRFPSSSDSFLQSLGLEYSIDTKKPAQILSEDGLCILKEGKRVSGIKIGGQPLIPDKYYKVAVNDFVFNGGNGYSQFKNAKNAVNTGIFIQDAIVEFIKKNTPVSVRVEDRIDLY